MHGRCTYQVTECVKLQTCSNPAKNTLNQTLRKPNMTPNIAYHLRYLGLEVNSFEMHVNKYTAQAETTVSSSHWHAKT